MIGRMGRKPAYMSGCRALDESPYDMRGIFSPGGRRRNCAYASRAKLEKNRERRRFQTADSA
jgi:hypothetical protein